MPDSDNSPYAPDDSGEVMTIYATNVTGAQTIPVEVPRGLPAEAVAESVAELMALPSNVPWALRDETSSAYLTDRQPIGEQIEPGARVNVTPKTHLGACAAAPR